MTVDHQHLHDASTLDLRILPIGKLLPHELHDEQRAAPLIRRLQQDAVLKNPPVVAPVGVRDDRFVILDGANRVVALDVLGIGHTLVQVVRYEEPFVELKTWYHAVSGLSTAELTTRLQAQDGIEHTPVDLFHARALLAARTILAYYVIPSGEVIALAGGGLDLHQRTRLLQSIVESYINTARLNRTNTDKVEELLTLYPNIAGALIFPKYEPVEILDLALSGLRVPPGITRHVVHGRALHLNYPLDKLAAQVPLEVKNRELATWLQQKFEKREVRYYAESTFLFDE